MKKIENLFSYTNKEPRLKFLHYKMKNRTKIQKIERR